MAIQVAGTNVDSGGAFTSYASGKISAAAGKYTGSDISAHRPQKERALFRTSRAVRLKSGLMLEGTGEDGDTCASADAAIEHLEKRHRRHKRRIKNQRGGHTTTLREAFVSGFTVKAGQDEAPAAGAGGAIPVIDAESERGLKEMQAREAVMQLDLIEKTFLVFRNAAHGGLNVVYRRADGRGGRIDPDQGGASEARPAGLVSPA